ncbi:ferredoxin [Rhodococcus koreensis]
MKIMVDKGACQGHGRCAAFAPDLYDLDDDGYCAVTELQVPTGQEPDAVAGEGSCPERAITLID